MVGKKPRLDRRRMVQVAGGLCLIVAVVGLVLLLWARGRREVGAGMGKAPSRTPSTGAKELRGEPNGMDPPGTLGVPWATEVGGTAVLDDSGSLVIVGVWSETGAAASNVGVEVRGAEGTACERAMFGTSGPDGISRFDSVPSGRARVIFSTGDSLAARVRAREWTRVDATLHRGSTIKGRVVDWEGHPVEGAAIWVSGDADRSRGFNLGCSDAFGNFELEGVGANRLLWATASGFSASNCAWIEESFDEITVSLSLGRAGPVVEGVVLGEGDVPVAGVEVRFFRPTQSGLLPDGRIGLAPRPEAVRTDRDGRFLIDRLPPVRCTYLVDEKGIGCARGEIDVTNGQVPFVEIRVTPGARLTGTVTTASGRGEPSLVEVTSTDRWIKRATRTGADGSYRLERLPPATYVLVASAIAAGKARAQLSIASDTECIWNPVLDPGLTLRGRVVDVDGNGLAARRVCAISKDRLWTGETSTDEAGRFSFSDCPDTLLILNVHKAIGGPTVACLSDVDAGAGDVTIVVGPKQPGGEIVGRVLDGAGDPRSSFAASATPEFGGATISASTDPATGRFRIMNLYPGRYHVVVRAPGVPLRNLGWVEIESGATMDLGDVELGTPGRLEVRLGRQVDVPAQGVWLAITFQDSQEHAGGVLLKGTTGQSVVLLPDSYLLRWRVEGFAWRDYPFRIAPGETSVLDIDPVEGIRVQVSLSSHGSAREETLVEVQNEATGVTWRARHQVPGPDLVVYCDPGAYTFTATSTSGRKGSARLEVAPEGGPVHVAITLNAGHLTYPR